MSRTIADIRCSTEEQADSRAGLEAQRAAILAEARRRGCDEADVTFIEGRGDHVDRPPPILHNSLDARTDQGAGYRIVREDANYAPRGRLLRRLSLGLFDDLAAEQRLFVARAVGDRG